MVESSRPAEPDHPVLAATPARQGRLGRPVFWVLVISTLLAAVALVIAWAWKAPGFSREDAKLAGAHARRALTASAPEPASVTQQQGSAAPAPPRQAARP